MTNENVPISPPVITRELLRERRRVIAWTLAGGVLGLIVGLAAIRVQPPDMFAEEHAAATSAVGRALTSQPVEIFVALSMTTGACAVVGLGALFAFSSAARRTVKGMFPVYWAPVLLCFWGFMGFDSAAAAARGSRLSWLTFAMTFVAGVVGLLFLGKLLVREIRGNPVVRL